MSLRTACYRNLKSYLQFSWNKKTVLTVSLHSTRHLLPSAFVSHVSTASCCISLISICVRLLTSDGSQASPSSVCRAIKLPTEATPPLLLTALLAVYSKCMLRLQIQHCTQTCCEMSQVCSELQQLLVDTSVLLLYSQLNITLKHPC